jgi:hypothetical protein
MLPERKVISVSDKETLVDAFLDIESQVGQAEQNGYVKDGNIFRVGSNKLCQVMVLIEECENEYSCW